MSGKLQEIEVLEKENLVLQLHLSEGKTFKEIAEVVGYSNPSGAQKAYRRALQRVEKPDVEELRTEVVSRLNAIVEAYAEPVINGDTRKAPVLLSAIKQIAEVCGLYAPIKVQQEVISYDGNRSLSAQVDQLARVIEYIEGSAANITTLATEPGEGEPPYVELPSA